ncbi:hypothetical protein [Streptomyces sp. A30]|uniref:hypothetical protein n=1 Tax=Streptomyces sp. A30 TaxID=2789273 RepID=UPI003980C494
MLDRLGLAHLQLSRSAATLSGGELQRTRLAALLSTELSDIIFVLDEPGTGLHPADKAHLLDTALELRTAGNTVLLVEHAPELIARADWVIDMGPGAGRLGGEVLVSGTLADVAGTPARSPATTSPGRDRGCVAAVGRSGRAPAGWNCTGCPRTT